MGSPSALPEVVVATVLAAAGLGLIYAPTANMNLFSGPEQPPGDVVPHACVFCIPYNDGTVPMPYFAGQAQDLRWLSVQVLVRGNVDGYDAANTLAYGCWQALSRKVTPSTGYLDILNKQGAPMFLGNDDTDHPRFVFNVQLRYEG
tara:strand:+ start:765 stop:1202 length:438 start_codon:yes stop_codon:yes gene_type:complete